MMWGPVRKLRERSSVAPTPLATIVFPIGHTVPMVFSGPVQRESGIKDYGISGKVEYFNPYPVIPTPS